MKKVLCFTSVLIVCVFGVSFSADVVPPVIDGNIVTGVRSRFYRQEMCEAIASAVGVFEEDPPQVSNVLLTPSSIDTGNWTLITATIIDASTIVCAEACIFTTDSEGTRNSTSPHLVIEMENRVI